MFSLLLAVLRSLVAGFRACRGTHSRGRKVKSPTLRNSDRLFWAALGIEKKPIAPHAPWQNPYAERLIGTIRRERLDRVIVMGERHLRAVLESYFGSIQWTRGQPTRS
ncbi:MAG: transposase [Verrucomicrobia bacterium]|nr:transposase [Verrucomicrobiota bacterium]